MMNEQHQQADLALTRELAAKRSTREELKRDLERLEIAARQSQPASPPSPSRTTDEERPTWFKR